MFASSICKNMKNCQYRFTLEYICRFEYHTWYQEEEKDNKYGKCE